MTDKTTYTKDDLPALESLLASTEQRMRHTLQRVRSQLATTGEEVVRVVERDAFVETQSGHGIDASRAIASAVQMLGNMNANLDTTILVTTAAEVDRIRHAIRSVKATGAATL